MKINSLKKFNNEFSDIQSSLKPQYKKYYDELATYYIDRKITNIKTVENHLMKLLGKGAKNTATKLDKLFNKLNAFNNLPSIQTTDYQPSKQKQTREQRINNFNNKTYKNVGSQIEKLYDENEEIPFNIIKKAIY